MGSHGWGRVNGGPCNDLTAVVTFLISARFNYTVDEEGAHSLLPPLELLQARARIPPGRLVGRLASQPAALFVPPQPPSSSFPHQPLSGKTRPVVLNQVPTRKQDLTYCARAISPSFSAYSRGNPREAASRKFQMFLIGRCGINAEKSR